MPANLELHGAVIIDLTSTIILLHATHKKAGLWSVFSAGFTLESKFRHENISFLEPQMLHGIPTW